MREAEDSCVSDLIEITVPFHKGIWTHTENKFVIFDTPGSNSASNLNHFEVLKKDMAGLTNGLPIFVTSNGLYFVSSIMGLGFKNDGDFIDDHSAEILKTTKKSILIKNQDFIKHYINTILCRNS